MLHLFEPFRERSKREKIGLVAFWLAAGFLFWQFWPGYMVPRPAGTIGEFSRLYSNGLAVDVWVSLSVVLRAGMIAFLFGCAMTYLYTIPFFKPPIVLYASMRNIMMNALIAAFLFMHMGGDLLKVITTAFMMSVYFVSSEVQRIDKFSKDELNHAVTMRMSRWQMLWHCVIRGKFHFLCYDFIPCLGMGWSMLAFVEGLSRSQGGLGDVMLQVDKISSVDGILALAITSGALGFAMWFVLRWSIGHIFKYADLTTA